MKRLSFLIATAAVACGGSEGLLPTSAEALGCTDPGSLEIVSATLHYDTAIYDRYDLELVTADGSTMRVTFGAGTESDTRFDLEGTDAQSCLMCVTGSSEGSGLHELTAVSGVAQLGYVGDTAGSEVQIEINDLVLQTMDSARASDDDLRTWCAGSVSLVATIMPYDCGMAEGGALPVGEQMCLADSIYRCADSTVGNNNGDLLLSRACRNGCYVNTDGDPACFAPLGHISGGRGGRRRGGGRGGH